MVRGALDKALASEKSLAIAPPDESAEQARAVLSSHSQLQPIFIWPKLQANNQGSTLKFKLSFTLFTYPDKAFKGSLAQKLAMQGAKDDDPIALRELMEVAAPKIVSRFLTNVERFK